MADYKTPMQKLAEMLIKGPPELSEANKTAMQVENERVSATIRGKARANLADDHGRSLDDIIGRVMEARRIGVAPDDPDAAWADARAETLKFKLAEAQQRAERERMREQTERLEREAAARRSAELWGSVAGLASVTTATGTSVLYGLTETKPQPKKPVEIPILTFGKRRINLKDVA